MAIKTSCPHCSQSYSLADSQLGKNVRCKSCTEPFVVRAEAARKAPPRSRADADDRLQPREVRRKKGGLPAWVWIVGGIGVAVLLLGCAGGGGLIIWLASASLTNKVTEENYNKIKTGMSEAEVKAILGEPSQVEDLDKAASSLGINVRMPSSGLRVLVWRNGNNHITLTFRNDKVVTMMSQFTTKNGGLHIQSKG
jgi:predicted Zn finger-like uncharacterized protein